MILQFPDSDTLLLALSSGVIPVEVQAAPATAAWPGGQPGETVLVQPSAPLPQAALASLKRLGVGRRRSWRGGAPHAVACWLQLLPLVAAEDAAARGRPDPSSSPCASGRPSESSSPSALGSPSSSALSELAAAGTVLLELYDERNLGAWVRELLRLNNDRLSFRQLEPQPLSDDSHRSPRRAQSTTLLRVVRPPYYTLLRAVERAAAGELQLFVEHAPRVWVELGQRHPLASAIRPAADQLLLIESPRSWRWLPERPFRDIYEALEVTLPQTAWQLRDTPLTARIAVGIRLAPSTRAGAAELWVLRDDPLGQIEALLDRSDDALISRLAFAAAEVHGDSLVVVRVRPSREPPPHLVLDGLACQRYQNLPLLFVPLGQRVHPPLRRDAVARLLVTDEEQLTWLQPLDDQQFVPCCIPDAAFRPLSDWVEYVMAHDRQTLAAWIDAFEFDFEGFVEEAADSPAAAKRSGASPTRRAARSQPPGAIGAASESSKPPANARRASDDPNTTADTLRAPPDAAPATAPAAAGTPAAEARTRERAWKELAALQDAFLALEAPLEDPLRRPMWRKLAELHGTLGQPAEATLAWSHLLWESEPSERQLWEAWLAAERQAAGLTDVGLEEWLPRLLAGDAEPVTTPALVPALLCWAAWCGASPAWVTGRLPQLTRLLEGVEEDLPVRTCWLAWRAGDHLAGGDLLLLARARDRLLQRLYARGLGLDRDVAAFVRAGGFDHSRRLATLRRELPELASRALTWTRHAGNDSSAVAATPAYAALMAAFALARLGELEQSRGLMQRGLAALPGDDPIHAWASRAFEFRIRQAADGDDPHQPLPQSLLDALLAQPPLEKFKLDRLRQASRILDPRQSVDPFREWTADPENPWREALAELAAQPDAASLARHFETLLHSAEQTAEQTEGRHQLLIGLLESAPRLDQSRAEEVLEEVTRFLAAAGERLERALVIRKAIEVAGHFGIRPRLAALVARLDEDLPPLLEDYLTLPLQYQPQNQRQVAAIDALLHRSFHDLRRLGMRDEIAKLFTRVGALAERPSRPAPGDVRDSGDVARQARLLLHAAGIRYHFDQAEQAAEQADRVRAILFAHQLPAVEQRQLAVAYAETVAQAPAPEALRRIAELFALGDDNRPRLPGIQDTFTTATHFSLSQLAVAETALVSLLGDHTHLSPELRRWLDEDEYLVRTRIHRDLQAAEPASGPGKAPR